MVVFSLRVRVGCEVSEGLVMGRSKKSPSVSLLLAGLGLAGRIGVICSVGITHSSSDLAALRVVSDFGGVRVMGW